MHYVYILYSKRVDRYYVGMTANVDRRLLDHNAGRSTYTKLGKPWVVVHREEFEDKVGARLREREIKSRKSRRYIEKLVQSVEGMT